MSMHGSLKTKNNLAGVKSVLQRTERVKKIQADKAWKDDSKVTGLPKVKINRIKTGKKK